MESDSELTEGQKLEHLYPEVTRCSKCGFCQPFCPIYRATGVEASVARGHHAHMRLLIEGRLDLTEDVKAPFFECLLCKACVANCPPAVATPDVVVEARAAYYKRFGRPAVQRFMFGSVLPHPRLMSAAIKPLAVAKRLGLADLAGRMGLMGLVQRDLPRSQAVLRDLPVRTFADRVGRMRLSPPEAEHRVAYFNSCGFNYALPQVAQATVRVLVAGKCAVEVRRNNCCGLPPWSYGDLDAARRLAKANLSAFQGFSGEAILTDCGSCSAFLREYPRLLADEPEWQERAAAFSAKVRDVSEYLVQIGVGAGAGRLNAVVTYHDPCHLSRPAGIKAQPRALLKSINGVAFKELPEADWCCGGAGTYNVAHYEQSMQVLQRKMSNVAKTGATILATSCPACMLQLQHGARTSGVGVEVLHVTQLLERALREPGSEEGGT